MNLRRPVLPWLLAVAALSIQPDRAEAQTCWAYVDAEPATPGIECVQKSDLSSPCAWPEDCTTVPSGDTQTMLRMHEIWHQCFGDVGGDSPPAGRGQRWYAFHRQYEFDYNLWRMELPSPLPPIEQHDWCPNMNLPFGHGGAGLDPDDHPSACGVGTGRPSDNECVDCIALPQCVFIDGGGPIDCPSAPSTSCSTPDDDVDLPYSSLDEFANVDEISLVLDAYFHGDMHLAVADGDGTDWDGNPATPNNQDCRGSTCSPRDPMFWRLHKALDDVVRAWQDSKAVDVMIVMDRSGSMSGADASGVTKLEAAVDAADYFGDLLEEGRMDGQTNRIGLVTYSSSASLELPLTPVDGSLRDPGAPFPAALSDIESTGPGGCTAIGAGVERALDELCAGGDCRTNPSPPPAGENARKAILLLTDGMENRPPCLQPAGPSGGGGCGSQCFGPQLDYENLEFTQLVGVGFGDSGSLNGDLLTLLAERQGGIYVQNPNDSDDDLKYFYAMAFGQISDEFLLVDPRGHLAADEAATPPAVYNSCSADTKLTFTSGWQHEVRPDELRLLVNDPSGDLVRPGAAGIESSSQRLWSTTRVRLPHRGESAGTWRAQLVRPHRQYVNGFASDVFPRRSDGIEIVRRQIQRLCPDGCRRTLLFEKGRIGPSSVYRDAVRLEREAGLLGDVVATSDARELASRLDREQWDLLVYARMGEDEREPYDDVLARSVCGGQRAVLTETRLRRGRDILECAGVEAVEPVNWSVMRGDGRLFDGRVKLTNPGHEVATVPLATSRSVQATALQGEVAAVAATADSGRAHNWFVNILGWGLGKLSPVRPTLSWSTGDQFVASARILPSFHRAGGWDHVDARVEVEYPRVGLGTLLAESGHRDTAEVEGELLDGRAATVAGREIPTRTAVFPLYDDGTHGDLNPGNGHWTGRLPGLGSTDGMYRFRYVFELTGDGCTTRREANQSMFVDVGVDPGSSAITVTPVDSLDVGGRRLVTVDLRPADRFGNLLGPGRAGKVTCGPGGACAVRSTDDHGDGTYTVELLARRGLAGARITGFGTEMDVALPCEDCVRLGELTVRPRRVTEHDTATATVRLTGRVLQRQRAGKAGGIVVYLSTNDTRVAALPDSVVVPAGRSSVEIPVTLGHLQDEPSRVVLSAHYGGDVRSASLSVRPERRSPARKAPAERTDSVYRTPGSAERPSTEAPRPPDDLLDELLSGPSFGDAEAPVVVVEFADYGCPHCQTFHESTFPILQARYIDAGEVRWIVKDFPIQRLHPHAFRAAEAAACGAQQGRLAETRRLLFSTRNNLAPGRIMELARSLPLDTDAFDECLTSGRFAEAVRRSRRAGARAGVRGTPTFFVLTAGDGRTGPKMQEVIRGAMPAERFSEVLDAALTRASGGGY